MKKLLAITSLLSIAALAQADYGVYGTTNTSSKATDNPVNAVTSPAVTSLEQSNAAMNPNKIYSNQTYNTNFTAAPTNTTLYPTNDVYPSWNVDKGLPTQTTPNANYTATPGNLDVQGIYGADDYTLNVTPANKDIGFIE